MTNTEEMERQRELKARCALGPDGVDEFGQCHYKLGQFVIIYYHGEIDWEYCLEEDDGLLSVFAGRAWIEDCDVLLMSAWKICDKAEWKTLDEYSKWRDSLPVWDKTPYFVKMVDMGGTRLMDCRTLQPSSKEEQERIMPKLGFSRTKV